MPKSLIINTRYRNHSEYPICNLHFSNAKQDHAGRKPEHGRVWSISYTQKKKGGGGDVGTRVVIKYLDSGNGCNVIK